MSEERFRAIVESSRDAVLLADGDGVLTYCSPGVEYLLGYRHDELVGTSERDLVHPTDRAIRDDLVQRIRSEWPAPGPTQLRMRRRDGSHRWVEVTSTDRLQEPGVQAVITFLRDVTERRTTDETLAHRALHDPLTGLPNRTLLADRIANALAHTGRSAKTVALLFCDLDHFKSVNDRLGHAAGDDLLRQVARRLAAILRPSDSLARIGGDEFVVLCDHLDSAREAEIVAERIGAAVAAPLVVQACSVTVTVSIGVATVDEHTVDSVDAATLLRNADAAMYRAKGVGRNRWEVFDAEMQADARRRSQLEHELHRALDRGELTVHYQPVVRLCDGTIVGAEALLRWDHPERGLIGPGEFLDVAESSGLIVPIGEWVLRQALGEVGGWQAANDALWVAVNVSGRQLGDGGLRAVLAASMAGLAPGSLHLELTESVLIDHSRAVGAELDQAIAIGAEIGIDDFGTGYSSMTYLQRHPVSFLKIDRSFVASLRPGLAAAADDHAPALVDAIIQLSETLDITVIAEGIETAAQAVVLEGMGCAYGQGFLFGRPVPAADMRTLLGATG